MITFGQIEMDRVVRYGCVVGKSRAEGRARGNVTNAVRSTHHLAARSARFSRVCDEIGSVTSYHPPAIACTDR